MSVLAGIDIRLHDLKIDYIDLIKLLLANGWNIEKGICAYLPLHDNDDFNWQSNININICDEELFNILRQKQKLKELIGVSLVWQDSRTGFSLLLSDTLSFSTILNSDRPKTDYGLTDFNWYLEKIIPVFNKHNIMFESVECLHHL